MYVQYHIRKLRTPTAHPLTGLETSPECQHVFSTKTCIFNLSSRPVQSLYEQENVDNYG